MHRGKEVYYIDYYSDGIRRRNMGFVRVREENGGWNLKIQIMGMSAHDNFNCKIYWKNYAEEVFLGEIALKGGQGNKELFWLKENRSYQNHRLLIFRMSENRYGECTIHCTNKEELTSQDAIHQEKPAVKESIMTEELTAAEKHDKVQPETNAKETTVNETTVNEEKAIQLCTKEEKKLRLCNKPQEGECSKRKKQYFESLEEKWEQLKECFPLVHPFEEQGAYIAISPSDLHILGMAYRTLEHNSFLVHGYYSYRHLILGKYATKQGERFYLGVPGTFEEREQMMAGMFGFEGYEHSGGMGYYMCEVSL